VRIVAALLAWTAAADAAPPKLYAAMFAKGHRWTYDVSANGETSVLTCEVAGVKAYAKAVASKITCDRELDSDYAFVPDGLWVATARGLARLPDYELPDTVDDSSPVIAAAPRASTKRTKDGYGGHYVARVFARKGMWCTQNDTTHGGAGDGAIETLCFKPGTGLAWGELDYRGGDPRDVVYTAR
jgi:hypothetical protein